jgi:NAD+ kinase
LKPNVKKDSAKKNKKAEPKSALPAKMSKASVKTLAYETPQELAAQFEPRVIAIVYRPGTPEAIKQAKELAAWLLEQGKTVFCMQGQKLIPECKTASTRNIDQIDLVIALGGDGTYLRAVRLLEGRQIPILGVNMGNLGFLTETRLEDLYKAVIWTLQNKMEFRSRSMLRVEVRRGGKLLASHVALNDAVIERGSNTHLINIEIFSQKHIVATIKADALIVASPTGSTAYNLAAGGPILHPEVRAIVVTPVCPHALTSRPLIFPDDQEVSFKVLTRDNRSILTVDGVNCGELTTDDEVVVVRNRLDHFVIRKPSSNYFTLLREKLQFGQRN